MAAQLVPALTHPSLSLWATGTVLRVEKMKLFPIQKQINNYVNTVFPRIDAAPRLVAALEWAPRNPRAERYSGRPRIDAARLSLFMTTWCVIIMRLSMLAPTLDRVGNFPCLEWQACPRGRDIESLKCACETHAARVLSRFEF